MSLNCVNMNECRLHKLAVEIGLTKGYHYDFFDIDVTDD
jgi:hypothetical protein